MSTKMYDAYKVNGDMKTVKEIRRRLSELALEKVTKVVTEFDAKGFKTIGELASRPELLGHRAKYPLGMLIRNEFLRMDLQDVIRANPMSDLLSLLMNYGAVLYELDGTFYMSIYNLDVKSLIKDGLIEDFHYQNQTDRPDDISEEDYEARSDVWEHIFEGNTLWVPSMSGFLMKL